MQQPAENSEVSTVPVLNSAAATLSHMLGVQVGIGTGTPNPEKHGVANDGKHELVRFTVHDQNIDGKVSEYEAALRQTLSQTPLNDYAQIENETKHAVHVKDALQEFVDAGATHLHPVNLVWAGFDKDVAEKDSVNSTVGDYETYERQANFSINFPHSEESDETPGSVSAKVKENIEGRIDAIKARIAEEFHHLMPNLDKKQIQQEVANLVFDVNSQSWGGSNDNVSIHIRSPKQEAIIEGKQEGLSPEQENELRESNILSRKSTIDTASKEQLKAAITNAVLYAGDKAMEIYPIIAGREDVHRNLENALTKAPKGEKSFKEQHPGLAGKIDAVLNDDIFKAHGHRSKESENLKQKAIFHKCPDQPGKMTVDLIVPAGKALQMAEKLAEMGQQMGVPQPNPAAAPLPTLPAQPGLQVQGLDPNIAAMVDTTGSPEHQHKNASNLQWLANKAKEFVGLNHTERLTQQAQQPSSNYSLGA